MQKLTETAPMNPSYSEPTEIALSCSEAYGAIRRDEVDKALVLFQETKEKV